MVGHSGALPGHQQPAAHFGQLKALQSLVNEVYPETEAVGQQTPAQRWANPPPPPGGGIAAEGFHGGSSGGQQCSAAPQLGVALQGGVQPLPQSDGTALVVYLSAVGPGG